MVELKVVLWNLAEVLPRRFQTSSVHAGVWGKGEAGSTLQGAEGSSISESPVVQPGLLPPWRLVPIWASR